MAYPFLYCAIFCYLSSLWFSSFHSFSISENKQWVDHSIKRLFGNGPDAHHRLDKFLQLKPWTNIQLQSVNVSFVELKCVIAVLHQEMYYH